VTPLRVTFVGGPLDGLTYSTPDEHVPNIVSAPGWVHYRAIEREYHRGRLVRVEYRHAPELAS
jgi:hypothetical protein